MTDSHYIHARRRAVQGSALHKLYLWLPLVALAIVGAVANAGGVAANANAANTVSTSSSISSDVHITSTCGTAGEDGTLDFGSNLVPGNSYEQSCAIVWGSTNNPSTLSTHATTDNLGWTGFSAVGSNCAALADGEIGIRVDSSSTSTRSANYNCAAAQASPIPTAPTSICTSAAGPDTSCNLVVRLRVFTTGAPAGAKSGTLTSTLT